MSRDGIIPISETQDTAGPMARNVQDAAQVLHAISGKDVKDSATANIPKNYNYQALIELDSTYLNGKRIGLLRNGEESEIQQKLLSKVGWSKDDVDLWEVNEAFAVVPMAFMRDMKISQDRLNIRGGAFALGHPIGASGTRIVVTLLNALEDQNLKKGVASICLGGGEALAMAIERA